MWTIVVALNKRGLLMEKNHRFSPQTFRRPFLMKELHLATFYHIEHQIPFLPYDPALRKEVLLWVRYSASFDLSNRMAVPVLYVNPLQFSHINSHKTIPVCCFSSRKAFSRYWSILAYFYFIDLWNYVVDRKLVNLCLIFSQKSQF